MRGTARGARYARGIYSATIEFRRYRARVESGPPITAQTMSIASLRACSTAVRTSNSCAARRRAVTMLSSSAMARDVCGRGLSSAPSESHSVGFVGLGKIGFAMANNMMKAGHSLTVFDLDPAAVDRLVAAGATAAGSAAEVAASTSRLVTVLPNDAILHQVVEEVRLDRAQFNSASRCTHCDLAGAAELVLGEVSPSGWLRSRRLLHGLPTGGACCRGCSRETRFGVRVCASLCSSRWHGVGAGYHSDFRPRRGHSSGEATAGSNEHWCVRVRTRRRRGEPAAGARRKHTSILSRLVVWLISRSMVLFGSNKHARRRTLSSLEAIF